MYTPKADTYDLLKTVGEQHGAIVAQQQPELVTTYPALTFSVSNNVPTYTLSAEIGKQDIEITVDIWADKSTTASAILATLVDTFITGGYMLTYSSDVPDPDGVVHVTNTFKLIK
jgi:hypothetical protein